MCATYAGLRGRSAGKKICLQGRRHQCNSWVRKIPWRRDRLPLQYSWASLVVQMVKNAMWETWVQPLGQEDLLEKGMATHSSILAWRLPWIEEPRGLQSMGSQRVRTPNTHHYI